MLKAFAFRARCCENFISTVIYRYDGRGFRTLPMAPIPIMPNFRPEGSLVGKNPVRQLPVLAVFSALVVFLNTAKIRNMAMSAVGPDAAFRVLQKYTPF